MKKFLIGVAVFCVLAIIFCNWDDLKEELKFQWLIMTPAMIWTIILFLSLLLFFILSVYGLI